MVVDGETGQPIRGAKVTRPAVEQSWNVQGLPEMTVMTGRFGRFSIPPARHTDFFFSFHTTPQVFTPTFTVGAEGYVMTNITSLASSNTHWSVDLRRIKLRRR